MQLTQIDLTNPNYFDWGSNCKKLGLDVEATEKVIETHNFKSVDDWDMFWTGYWETEWEQ